MESQVHARKPARLPTTRAALGIGLGVLLTLLILSGLDANLVMRRLESNNEQILQEYLRRESTLDALRSAIYVSGTYLRDYLLETDPAKAEQSRTALLDTRGQIEAMLARMQSNPDASAQPIYGSLTREIGEYWRALDPVLGWNTLERHQKGYRFLHDEVLPWRSSTLGIADTIASVNQQQLVERDHRLVEMFTGLRNQLTVGVVLMFLCGLGLAFATAVHILRLQSQTITHLKEVTGARQELRNLSARLVETQENERKNISRDLHDAVGQSMSAVQFELHDLRVALASSPEALRNRVDRIREQVESSVAMVRNMALLLRPSMLDDLGLATALEWQGNQVSRSTGVRVAFSAEGAEQEVPEEHKVCIFRIVQEALNNVCKHARASSVEIALRYGEKNISVTIRDDGRGFRTPRNGGLGLIGMQERAEALGGHVEVTSELGRGTAIEATLPMPPSTAAANPLAGRPEIESELPLTGERAAGWRS